MMPFVLAWTSGHTPSKVCYYLETEAGYPSVTYDRGEATRFKTRAAAVKRWNSFHKWPEDYIEAWQSGRIRVEHECQPALNFGGKPPSPQPSRSLGVASLTSVKGEGAKPLTA